MSYQKRVFRNFLTIYLIFVLCMMLLLIPLYLVSLRDAENRTLATTSETLHAGVALFEAALERATGAGDTLYRSDAIRQLNRLDATIEPADAVSIRDAQTLFRSVTNVLPLAAETGLYLPNGALLLNPRGRYYPNAQDIFDANSLSNYLYEIDGVAGQSFDELRSHMRIYNRAYSLTELRWGRIGPNAPENTLFYVLALPLNTPARSTLFFATYKTDTLLELLTLPQYRDACALTITDSDGNECLRYESDASDAMVELAYRSPTYKFDVSLRISRSIFSEQLHALRLTMLLGFVVYGLAGLVLALIFSRHNARPMANLIANAEQAGLESGVSLDSTLQSVSSYQYIHALIDSMGREITVSRRKQELQMVQLQESMFDRLLRGDLHHESGLLQARSFFPDFPPCACMMLIRLLHSHEMDPATFTRVQLTLSDVYKSHLPPTVRVHLFSNLTVLLCPCQEETYQDTCANLISTLTPHLSDLNVRFAVSTPLHGLEALAPTFQHLRHLLHIVGDTGERVVFAQDNAPTPAQEHSYSSIRFYEMLLRGERDIALALMDEDVRLLKQHSHDNDTEIQQLFFIYRHELMRAKEEIQHSALAADPIPPLPDYLPQLSVDELFGQLRRCCSSLCDCIGASRVSERESFERKLLTYIDTHLSDPTLCIRSVVDQFSISESTLRNMLTKTAGMSFSEYVEQHRMLQAKLLVQSGSVAVSQIPPQCGYASANTFYKAFKRHYGISPTGMRAQLQGLSDESEDPS